MLDSTDDDRPHAPLTYYEFDRWTPRTPDNVRVVHGVTGSAAIIKESAEGYKTVKESAAAEKLNLRLAREWIAQRMRERGR